ncbi:MAG: DUF975 family protein [Lachnospiraceae bacterium]|nr:DUF975 family protein [Lachnospiraceae bacterium]
MMQFQTSSQLKSMARELLLGNYRRAISISLVSSLIIATIDMMATLFLDPNTLSGIILMLAIALILEIFSGVLILGITAFYLNLSCHRPGSLSDLFLGFKRHTNKAISVQFILLMVRLLPLLPPIVLWYYYLVTGESAVFLLFCLLLIAGGSCSVWFSLRYSQAYYLLLDFPQLTSSDALRHSIKIMKGHKARLFYLQVSFLPLILLGILSLGVGLFFIIPYQNMSLTLFYLDLIKKQTHSFYAEV